MFPTNVALPDLARSFPAAGVSDPSWVVSSYAVLVAALLTPAGRIADALGRKRVFLPSPAAFTAASALCAAAPGLPWLIAAGGFSTGRS
jgi:MFS family permease